MGQVRLVNKVTQGSWTYNTGNVAKSFFKNSKKVVNIIGINFRINQINSYNVVYNFQHLVVKININKFD